MAIHIRMVIPTVIPMAIPTATAFIMTTAHTDTHILIHMILIVPIAQRLFDLQVVAHWICKRCLSMIQWT